jgi:hypothetical protein
MSHIVKVKFTQIYDLKLITILAELGDHLKSEMIKKMKLDVHAVGDLYWSIKSKQIKVWLENADRSERIAEATIEEELIFIDGTFRLFDVQLINVDDLKDLGILYAGDKYAYVVRDGADILGVCDNLEFAKVIERRSSADMIEIVRMNR